MRAVLLSNIGTPSKNGLIFPREVVEKVVANRKDKLTFGQVAKLDKKGHLDLTRISHVVENVRIEGNDLVCDVTPYETPDGILLNMFLEKTKFAIAGYVEMNSKKEITSLDVHSINVVQAKE